MVPVALKFDDLLAPLVDALDFHLFKYGFERPMDLINLPIVVPTIVDTPPMVA
jgi:hypothetical protein